MEFEFNPAKSASNKAKHDIDFEQAKVLWTDDRLVELPARHESEQRRLAIGAIAGKIWTAIFTMREGRVRLISVRRARDEEVELYEDHQG